MRARLLLLLLLLAALLAPAPVAPAPRAAAPRSAKYAVDCPERCDRGACRSPQRCERTVLDDCGCCRVCAARRGETCYRTVSGMDGVKCGPGLRCQFYSEEDDFGDEFGVCKGKQRPRSPAQGALGAFSGGGDEESLLLPTRGEGGRARWGPGPSRCVSGEQAPSAGGR